MTSEELKKKIVEILDNNIRWQPYYYISRGIVYEEDLKNIADALILEGIGYVWDITEKAEKAIASLIKQNKELQHRAEVAERGFNNTIKVFHDMLSAIFPSIKIDLDEWKKDNLAIAEKELAEEKK